MDQLDIYVPNYRKQVAIILEKENIELQEYKCNCFDLICHHQVNMRPIALHFLQKEIYAKILSIPKLIRYLNTLPLSRIKWDDQSTTFKIDNRLQRLTDSVIVNDTFEVNRTDFLLGIEFTEVRPTRFNLLVGGNVIEFQLTDNKFMFPVAIPLRNSPFTQFTFKFFADNVEIKDLACNFIYGNVVLTGIERAIDRHYLEIPLSLNRKPHIMRLIGGTLALYECDEIV